MLVAGLFASQTFAGLMGNGSAIIRVDASNGSQSGYVEYTVAAEFSPEGVLSWVLPEEQREMAITSGDMILATIHAMDVTFVEDPSVTLNFWVTAGAATTHFSISSAVLAFPTINNPLGFATAAITVTDGDSNGGTLTGTLANGKAYEARYNAGPITWASLVSPVTTIADDSTTGNERQPVVGRQVIPASVSSIQSIFEFDLTANDSASGTSRFDIIVPEPMTIALLASGFGLLAYRRR